MNTERKILFTDLDDTLLNRRKELPQENAEAINQALDAGHVIVFNTGRPLPAVLPLLKRLRLDRAGCFAVTYNGGLIYDLDQEKVLYKKSIPLSHVCHIFREAEAQGLYCQTFSDTSLLCRSYTEETDFYVQRSGIPWEADPGFPDTLTDEPIKVLVIHLHDKNRLDDYRRKITPWAENKLAIFYSNDYYLEHVAYGISKGESMQFLCRHLGISMDQTIAVGDAENDISMIKAAHTGIAMQNASEDVKAAADYVTSADCDHCGFREAILKFMLF